MFILCGKSASGKDTVAKELISRGYQRILTYTTRPMRPLEKNGVTYNFISQEEFDKLKEDNFFTETNMFVTKFGKWYYGSALKDYVNDDKKFIILAPDGVRAILRAIDFDPYVIYLFANLNTIKERLKRRGDDPKEVDRRIQADLHDFKGFELESDIIIYNNNDKSVSDVVDKIENFLNKDEDK